MVSLVREKVHLLSICFSAIISLLFFINLFLPWWKAYTSLGEMKAYAWGYFKTVGFWRDPAFTFPVILTALFSLLASFVSRKFRITLLIWSAVAAPLQILGSMRYSNLALRMEFLSEYVKLNPDAALGDIIAMLPEWPGVAPSMGVYLYILATTSMAIFCAWLIFKRFKSSSTDLRALAFVIAFSGFLPYQLDPFSYFIPYVLPYAILPIVFSIFIAICLWITEIRRLFILEKTAKRLLFIPLLLVALDAVTTSIGIQAYVNWNELNYGTSYAYQSGNLAMVLAYWSIVSLQVGATSYLALGFLLSPQRKSIWKVVPGTVLFALLTAYSSTISGNVAFILTGQNLRLLTAVVFPSFSILFALVFIYHALRLEKK